jgi:aminopeptidase N
LRWKLGDQVFFKAIRDYLAGTSFSYAKTPQLKKYFEAASGHNLDSFFAKWHEGQGYPVYNITWASTDDKLKIKVS